MPEEFQPTEEMPLNKNALAAVVAGILVIIAGFLIYNYFTKAGKISEEAVTIEEELPAEETGEEGKLKVEERKEEGEIAGEATKEEKKLEAPKPSFTGAWVANNIQPNTVSGDKYTVKKGDTLWEIAEGRYGSGFQWTKILEANKDKVGFLPNGSQALIEVGQELVLPD